MPTTFFSIPHRLEEGIALSLFRTHLPLHLICPMLHATSSSDANPPFYSMLLFDNFDISSPRRHLSQSRLSFRNIEQEVKHRYIALQIIRRREIWHPNLVGSLATVYVMLLEDDERNWEQVVSAGLPTFLPIFMRERLLEGASDNHGWPLENEVNTLAVALFWLISSRGRCGFVLLPGPTLRLLYRSPRPRNRRIQKRGHDVSRSVRPCGLSGMCIPYLLVQGLI